MMADSVLKAILDQVQADIRGLNLIGIASESVQLVKVFNDAEELLPTLPVLVKNCAAGGGEHFDERRHQSA